MLAISLITSSLSQQRNCGQKIERHALQLQ
jgi:hypothetical protein